jgi:hypothetical protein
MTEEQIKEQLSRRFVEVLATRRGFKCKPLDPDHGVDLDVTRALPRNGTPIRYLDTGEHVELQLKSTTESSLSPAPTGYRYDLEAKTYNDLVHRNTGRVLVPLILVVVVLPDDPLNWVSINDDALLVRRAAYWYQPPAGAALTTNTSTIRIELETGNRVDLEFMPSFFKRFFA